MSVSVKLTLPHFLEVAQGHQLWGDDDKLIIGISAGPDSVALAHLAFCTKQLAGLAHVNYHLRGEESEMDEQLVHKLGRRWQVPVYVKYSSHEEVTSLSGHSLQMAARTVRYSWWESLIHDGRGTKVLTGHQADDQIETILMHWIRGTGLAGWSGIPIRRDFICRPLLSFSRDQILDYLSEHNLPFRWDRSNENDQYLRNRIRHHVVPELKSIQSGLTDLVHQQSQDAQMALCAADSAVNQLAQKILHVEGSIWRIQLSPLQQVPWASYALYRWLQPMGFSRSQIMSIHDLSEDAHGQAFQSSEWEAVVDRGILICRPHPDSIKRAIYQEISAIEHIILCQTGRMTMERSEGFTPSDPADRNRVVFDAHQLQFPLTLRSWQPGDRMRPYGMSGTKKIKDILIDDKTSPYQKQETLVLQNGQDNEIIWLIGHRFSQSVQPDPDTKNMVILTWIPNTD